MEAQFLCCLHFTVRLLLYYNLRAVMVEQAELLTEDGPVVERAGAESMRGVEEEGLRREQRV